MKKNHVFLRCFLIVLFWSILVFAVTAFMQNVSWKELLFSFGINFYRPHYNSFFIGKVGAIEGYFYIYLILILSITTIYMLKMTVWRTHEMLNLRSLLYGVMGAALLVTVSLQTIGQTYYFVRESQWYSKKAPANRYPGALKEIVEFAGFCKEKLPGNHSCQFISDLNLSNDPGMFFHRTLAYHLYPIDIRDIRRDPIDCAIVFVAANPRTRVPEGYDIIGIWGPESLLAIKIPTSP